MGGDFLLDDANREFIREGDLVKYVKASAREMLRASEASPTKVLRASDTSPQRCSRKQGLLRCSSAPPPP